MKAKGRDTREDSKPALVKRELEQLLEYKRRQLRDLELGEGEAKEGAGLKGMQDEIQTVREQVDGLESHLRSRQEALEELPNHPHLYHQQVHLHHLRRHPLFLMLPHLLRSPQQSLLG